MSHYNSIDADDDDVSALTPSNHLKTSPTDFVEWGYVYTNKQTTTITIRTIIMDNKSSVSPLSS